MSTTLEDQPFAQQSATVFHPISATDKAAMAAMRTIVEPNKGRMRGVAARVPFDAIMEHVAAPGGVTFEAGAVGDVPGWWSKPKDAQPDAVILHIHGGWFNWGFGKSVPASRWSHCCSCWCGSIRAGLPPCSRASISCGPCGR